MSSLKIKIAVFGSGGLLGTDLVKNAPLWADVTPLHRNTDIRNKKQILEVINTIKPDWVINSAGFSDVDGCEKDRELALSLNVTGPTYLAEVCHEAHIPFIHISTDYVFDGKGAPYVETDEPHPINYYGVSKREGEIAVQKFSGNYVVRVSTLYGFSRKNHALGVLEAMKTGKGINLAHDLYCTPSYTKEIADGIFQLIDKKAPFGIYHGVSGGFCSRYEFGMNLVSSLDPSKTSVIKKIEYGSLMLKAERPLKAVLSNQKWEKMLGVGHSWEFHLAQFLEDLKLQPN